MLTKTKTSNIVIYELKLFTITSIFVTANIFEVGGDVSAAYGVVDKTKKNQKLTRGKFRLPFEEILLEIGFTKEMETT